MSDQVKQGGENTVIIIDENGEGLDRDDFREKVEWRNNRDSGRGVERNPA